MKRTIIMFSLIALACAACNDGDSSGKFSGRAWNTNLSERDDALERAIIADALGGVVADTVIPADLSLAGVPPLDNEGNELEEVSLQKSLTPVADTYEYPSVSGEGVLSITVSGNMEEVDVFKKEQRAIRFFPLVVTFSFEHYDYVNSCGLPATITGSISCKFQGEINRSSDIISGTGSCMTGSSNMSGNILYELGLEEEHNLSVQTTIVAQGLWYELTTYQVNGSYMLDNRSGNVDSIIAKAAAECAE